MSKETDLDFFAVEVVLKEEKYFFLWNSDTQGFLEKKGSIVFFRDLIALKEDFPCSDITVYDLNWIAKDENFNANINCNMLIDIWNFFSDFFQATNGSFMGDCKKQSINQLYDKLFYSCNLLVPKGEKIYYPHWNRDEILLLKQIMLNGLRNFTQWTEKKTEDGSVS